MTEEIFRFLGGKSSNRFWEVCNEGSILTSRHGKVGDSGKVKERELISPDRAAAGQMSFIRRQLGQGYKPVFNIPVSEYSLPVAISSISSLIDLEYLTDEEIDIHKSKLIQLDKKVSIKQIKNKIVNQNLEKAIEYLPDNFVDLMFIDPPYNLNKKFNLVSFRSMDLKEYENWFESWFSKLVRILKDTASVYICGDWKSSNAILNVGMKYLTVRNRITWEREKGRGAKSNWKN